MSFEVRFWVAGTPAAQGDHIALCPRGKPGGLSCRPVLTDHTTKRKDGTSRASRLKVWRAAIIEAGRPHQPPQLLDQAVVLGCLFYFDRPARNRDPYPTHSRVPDLDKLIRAVGDALSCTKNCPGLYLRDDKRIMEYDKMRRLWTAGGGHIDGPSDTTGAWISIRTLGPAPW